MTSFFLFVIFNICLLIYNLFKLNKKNKPIKTNIITDDESVVWLNLIINKFWISYEPQVSNIIINRTEKIFKKIKIYPIKKLSINKIFLGNSPLQINSIRVLKQNIPDNRIVMNTEVEFIAPDLEIELNVKTLITLPFLVKQFYLKGNLRIELEILPEFPYIQSILCCFITPPTVDFDLLPLYVNITNLPLISNLIYYIVNNEINNHLVNPEKILIPLFEKKTGNYLLSNGITLVTLVSIESKISSEIYVKISTNFTKKNTNKIICSKKQLLINNTYALHTDNDLINFYIKSKKRNILGKYSLPNENNNVILDITDYKLHVKLVKCNYCNYFTNKGSILIIIHNLTQIKNGEYYCVLYNNSNKIYKTKVVRNKNFEEKIEYISNNIETTILSIRIYEFQNAGSDRIIGELELTNENVKKKIFSIKNYNLCLTMNTRYIDTNINFNENNEEVFLKRKKNICNFFK